MDWLCWRFCLKNRKQAVEIGLKMNEKALFFHENHSHVFEDQPHLYYVSRDTLLYAPYSLSPEQRAVLEGKKCFLTRDLRLDEEEMSSCRECMTDCFMDEFSAVEIARQIALVESELFRRIDIGELDGQKWSKGSEEEKREKAPTVSEMISFSNRFHSKNF